MPSLRPTRIAALLTLLTSVSSLCLAQTPPHPPNQDLKALVKAASQRMSQADDSKTRFTRFDLEHTTNRNKKGKLTIQYTALYEDTWINDLPYKRLVEWNGKPLTGAALAAEQARYDKAVADRQKLNLAARAAYMHQKFTNTAIKLNKILTPDYHLFELRQQTLDGQPTHVLEADPHPSLDPAHPIPQQSFELWITDTDPAILRLTCNILDDEPNLLHGSSDQAEFQLIDGLPLISHETFHAFMPFGRKTILVDTEHTYTRYRRFSTTVTIISAPSPDAPPQNPPSPSTRPATPITPPQ